MGKGGGERRTGFEHLLRRCGPTQIQSCVQSTFSTKISLVMAASRAGESRDSRTYTFGYSHIAGRNFSCRSHILHQSQPSSLDPQGGLVRSGEWAGRTRALVLLGIFVSLEFTNLGCCEHVLRRLRAIAAFLKECVR